MMAFDAEASSTSVSVIAPTPECSTRILTLSFDSFCSVSVEHFGRAADVGLEDDVAVP